MFLSIVILSAFALVVVGAFSLSSRSLSGMFTLCAGGTTSILGVLYIGSHFASWKNPSWIAPVVTLEAIGITVLLMVASMIIGVFTTEK